MRIEHGAYFSRVVREQLFAPGNPERRLVAARMEVIPLLADSGRVCAIERDGGVSSADLLRRFGSSRGWREYRDANGAPRFLTREGVTVKFSAGGQIAFSAAPSVSIDELLRALTNTIEALHDAARAYGVNLVARGIDPVNNILDVPLQLETERNVRLANYLDTLGPSGARHMRQAAGLTIHVDAGRDPGGRWQLLSALSPFFTAIFATSRRYAGVDSGLQSYRAYCRRTLDPSRTDVAASARDPRDAYLEFALDALDVTRRRADGRYTRYRDWISTGDWSTQSWEAHLASLYPDVRPRGHFELCSIDALPLRWVAAPIVLVCGLTYDDRAAREAAELIVDTDDAMPWRAAGPGLHDANVSRISRDLVDLALRGAHALGAAYVSGEHLETAREYFDHYTLRGRAPSDDASDATPPRRPTPKFVMVNRVVGFA